MEEENQDVVSICTSLLIAFTVTDTLKTGTVQENFWKANGSIRSHSGWSTVSYRLKDTIKHCPAGCHVAGSFRAYPILVHHYRDEYLQSPNSVLPRKDVHSATVLCSAISRLNQAQYSMKCRLQYRSYLGRLARLIHWAILSSDWQGFGVHFGPGHAWTALLVPAFLISGQKRELSTSR